MWREFRSSQPLQGWRGLILICCDLRMTPLLWTPPGPTSVATVSQFAAPWDGEASL